MKTVIVIAAMSVLLSGCGTLGGFDLKSAVDAINALDEGCAKTVHLTATAGLLSGTQGALSIDKDCPADRS